MGKGKFTSTVSPDDFDRLDAAATTLNDFLVRRCFVGECASESPLDVEFEIRGSRYTVLGALATAANLISDGSHRSALGLIQDTQIALLRKYAASKGEVLEQRAGKPAIYDKLADAVDRLRLAFEGVVPERASPDILRETFELVDAARDLLDARGADDDDKGCRP
jgi:hypothetical protein